MPNPVFPPRFAVDEAVTVIKPVLDTDGRVALPAGLTRHIVAVLGDGNYQVRPFFESADRSFMAFSGRLTGTSLVTVPEDHLQEAAKSQQGVPYPEGAGVQGLVERLALRERDGSVVGLLQLKGCHELFIVYPLGFDAECSLRSTQIGDKVRFVVQEADENRPRVNKFQNLMLD